jgi:hypothetical protein
MKKQERGAVRLALISLFLSSSRKKERRNLAPSGACELSMKKQERWTFASP